MNNLNDPALFFACVDDDLDMAIMCIRFGCDVHWAVYESVHFSSFKILTYLAKNFDVYYDLYERICDVVRKGDFKMVKFLANYIDMDDEEALEHVCLYKDYNIAKFMLKARIPTSHFLKVRIPISIKCLKKVKKMDLKWYNLCKNYGVISEEPLEEILFRDSFYTFLLCTKMKGRFCNFPTELTRLVGELIFF